MPVIKKSVAVTQREDEIIKRMMDEGNLDYSSALRVLINKGAKETETTAIRVKAGTNAGG